MRIIVLTLIITSIGFLISCENNVEDPGIDCTAADLSVSITSSVMPECADPGSLTVLGSGGTTPYSYTINGGGSQTSDTFSGLSAGTYTITITDSDGCTSAVTTVLDAANGGITLTLTATDADCGVDIGSINATANGGDGNYTYSLNGGTGQSSGEFLGLSSGSYTVQVNDGEGCFANSSVSISTGTSLTSDVMPIILSSCATSSSCHSSGASGSRPKLTTAAEIIAQAERIKDRTSNGSMPPAGQQDLTSAQIDLIACWVDDGANNN